jgi:hypothetical protein
MRQLTTLAVVLLVATLLAAAAPVSAKPVAFRHYVGCGLSQNAKPRHKCPLRSKKGAFFKSVKADITYTVCVRFPTRKVLCTKKPEEATQGTLYVNKIRSNIPGKHRVTWFVKGRRVGVFNFRVTQRHKKRK